MLSGLYSHQNGVWNNSGALRPEDSLLLRSFLDAGYSTASVGKVHLGIPPRAAGFQVHRNIEHDGCPHTSVPADYPKDWPWKAFGKPGYPQPIIYATDTCPRERTYCAVGVNHAIELFETHDFAASPLLLRLSLDRPHTPVSSPKPYDTMYAARTAAPAFDAAERAAQPPSVRHQRESRDWGAFSEDEVLKIRYYYFGLVTHLDFEIGRLLDAVERSPQRANTIVALTCDHGCMLGEHGLYVKGPHYYEETARVPFVLSWPGVLPEGCRAAGLVEMIDFLPTLCELAGLEKPPRAAGRSLLPVIRSESAGREDVFAEQVYSHNGVRWEAIRTERYCYARYGDGGASLFDLHADPEEMRNLASEAPADLLADLNRRIDRRLAAR
ncbi:MAG: Arylsulfatase [candidate division BRC1 bacterium ADurb.BinA364]|nr:MAG: Arylsulfatase [candidate division BRC1 bacterium ADurb.BinA364]